MFFLFLLQNIDSHVLKKKKKKKKKEEGEEKKRKEKYQNFSAENFQF